MIKFFRKIRRKLLTENRFSKYLVYAIGEMVLVVLGILIALQINVWKENIEKERKKDTYIESLKKDLALDITELEYSINEMNNDLQALLQLSDRISSENATIDTLISIFRNEFSVYFNPANSVNNKTFESINSTGNLDILDPWLREGIIEHNSAQLQTLKIVADNFHLHLQTTSTILSNYPYKPELDVFGQPLFLKRDGTMDENFWDDIDETMFTGQFNGLLNSKIQMENIITGIRGYLLEDTKALLDTLNQVYPAVE